MKFRLTSILIFGFAILSLTGCRSTPAPRPPEQISTADFDTAAQTLVAKMLSDTQFQKKYESLVKTLPTGRMPVFVLQRLNNNTSERLQARIDSLAKDVRILCRKSGKFDVKDDSATQTMVDRIRSSAKDGLETGELLSAFKRHVSPHYLMTGEVEEFQDADCRVYKLYLRLFDLSGASGDGGLVIWEDFYVVSKLD